MSPMQNYTKSWKVFVFVYSIVGSLQFAYFAFTSTIVTSLERQFKISSSYSGILFGAYDMVRIPFLLFLPFIGRDWHIPRSLGLSHALSGLMLMLVASTHFMTSPSQEYSSLTINGVNLIDNGQQFCIRNSSEVNKIPGESAHRGILVILFLAMGLLGAFQLPRNSLFYTFLDENCPKNLLPVIYGCILFVFKLGSLMGFSLAIWCNKIFYSLAETSLEPEDNKWIGAWWLGLMIIGVLMLILSPLLFFFPRHLSAHSEQERNGDCKPKPDSRPEPLSLPGAQLVLDHHTSQEFTIYDSASVGAIQSITVSECGESLIQRNGHCHEKLDVLVQAKSNNPRSLKVRFLSECKEYWRVMKRLALNRLFISLVASMVVLSYYQSGFGMFQVKYYETQFHIPAWKVSLILGFTLSVLLGVAASVGGLISSHLSLNYTQMALKCSVCTALATIFILPSMFLTCPGAMDDLFSNSSRYVSESNDCNKGCHCSPLTFTPVRDANSFYSSACMAGCLESNVNHTVFQDANVTVYDNCICTDGGRVTEFIVETPCSPWLAFLFLSFLPTVCIGLTLSTQQVLAIRSVEKQDTTVAMGLSKVFISLLGWMPAMPLFGGVIDTTCRVWSELPDGETGNCWLYDREAYRYKFIGLVIATLFTLTLIMTTVTSLTKTARIQKELSNEKEYVVS